MSTVPIVRQPLLALLVAAFLAAGCAAYGQYPLSPGYPPKPEPPTCPDPVRKGLGADPTFQRACSPDHWLALAAGKDKSGAPLTRCPEIAGSQWQATSLFGDDGRYERPLFCRYDWVVPPPDPCRYDRYKGKKAAPKAQPDRADFELLRSNPNLHGAVRRCAVVGLQQGAAAAPSVAAEELSREMFFRELLYQVGVTYLPLPAGQEPSVRLAVVDTQPTGLGPPQEPCPDCSGHGYALAHLARNLTCPLMAWERSSCAAQIATRLAIPLRQPEGDPAGAGELARPGHFGRPSDLALAIDREVKDWLADGRQKRLILNLSLGWDSELLHEELPGEGADGLNAEELAVYEALRFAREKGVLVLAASGNSAGGLWPGRKALLPALWSAEPPVTQGLVAPAPEPLLYAIGAVDRREHPLANVRRDSLPALVAYGDHVTVPVPGGGWTQTMTGTSVATAVASAIAAVTWHLRQDLDADGVMALLSASARSLPYEAELHRSGKAPRVKLLRLPSALSWSWSRARLDEVSGKEELSTAPICTPAEVQLTCAGKPTTVHVCEEQTAACPPTFLTSVNSVPWVLTQPGQNPCPSCSLISGPPVSLTADGAGAAAGEGWTLYIVIAKDWPEAEELRDPVLELLDPDTNDVVETLPFVPLPDGYPAGTIQAVKVTPKTEGDFKARVTFKVEVKTEATSATASYSAESQVYVGWPKPDGGSH